MKHLSKTHRAFGQSIVFLLSFTCSLLSAQEIKSELERDTTGHRLNSSPTAYSEVDGFSGDAYFYTILVANTVGANVRLTKKLADNVYIGASLNAGLAFSLVFKDAGVGTFAGVGPSLTIGGEKGFVNFGAHAYALGSSGESLIGYLPTIGGSAKVSDKLRFNAELVIPMSKEFDTELGIGMVGFRYGKKWYAELNFLFPVGLDDNDYILGVPFFAIGRGF